MNGKAITKLLQALDWTHEQLAAAMDTEKRGLLPAPDADRVREWEERDTLTHPVALCLRDIAATELLIWDGRKWLDAPRDCWTGADVKALREALCWPQSRLARELGTRQQAIAAWEAKPGKALTGLASYALRACKERNS